MTRRKAKTIGWTLAVLLAIQVLAQNAAKNRGSAQAASSAEVTSQSEHEHWIGTWAAAPQPSLPGRTKSFHNQTLRLIVHASAGGTKVRIKISNIYGDQPLLIGAAHIARRTAGAEIDPVYDRVITFDHQTSTTVPARSLVVSDPIKLDVPALSDLSISLFLPGNADANTMHILAKQTSYVSSKAGNFAAATKFLGSKEIHFWPFLTGVDVSASPSSAAIVAFGSSLTDGDGTSADSNHRWPDVLSERLQKARIGEAPFGVLNEGIIGNRLLADSPQQPGSPFGGALGEAGLTRFNRDVLAQAGVQYAIVGLGINDVAFPGSLTPAEQKVSADSIIAGYRQLIARAHQNGIRIIGTTNPAFEGSFLPLSKTAPPVTFYTAAKELVREEVNDWILTSGEFDAVIDFDRVLRDPTHPTRIAPAYDSGDHLHPNDAGCTAEGNAVPLALFQH